MHPLAQQLDAGLAQLGLNHLSPEIRTRLLAWHDHLLETNQNLNLTGHKEPADSLVKNLINSLAPWRHIDPQAPTADIGTGGGIPGMPLAIALDMPNLTLIESKQKKCRFLEQAASKFAPAVKVRCGDAAEFREPMDQILCAGFGTLGKLLQVTRFCRSEQCRVVAWKGKLETAEAEAADAGWGFGWEMHRFEVPGLEAERHICIGTRKL